MTKKTINELSYEIIGGAIEVHRELGPGLLENVYEKCLIYVLKEKGLDVLLEAWKLFYDDSKNAELILAGNFPHKEDIPADSNLSITTIPRFIDDYTYCKLISESDLVVLPYKRGTNSGIPSSIVSLDVLLITSDIPMFSNNTLIDETFLFKNGDASDLSKKLSDFSQMSQETKDEYLRKNRARFIQYREEFKSTINEVYFSMITNKNK